MEARKKRNEESVLRLKKIASSLSGLEVANSGDNMTVNSPRAMGRKRIAVLTEISGKGNGNSAFCSVKDGQNRMRKHSEGVSSVMPSPDIGIGNEENLGLDSLPVAILVRIICNVSHDELETLSGVSHKFKEAVNVARQMHFDYKTPVRIKAPKRMPNALLLNAPKKSGKFQKSRLSAQNVKELQTSTRQARMMIEDL
ncbi:hypothetical protein KI387_034387 [Taxus chinensis]|uniref:F-box domain-containing protein n=1 Tax=Taxus chinensis TaxID=29808 RepID=A0AA38BWG8_TAXCH|nr:hypothetical protein KI387_034387 [Taxus chinensis]